MIERINIRDAGRRIGYSDMRSFRRWILRNKLTLFRDAGSKMHYLIKKEFEDVADKVLYDQINGNHKSFVEEFDARLKVASEYLSAVDEQKKSRHTNAKYKPIGEHGKRVLSRLLKIIDPI